MKNILTSPERSSQMRLVKSKNTKPEIFVRKACRMLGQKGYRLHRKDLPGKPDVAFIRKKLAIFVNGCFWHGHNCHGKPRLPKTNVDYWLPKIQKNIDRDKKNIESLKAMGWHTMVIWECETKDLNRLTDRLKEFFSIS